MKLKTNRCRTCQHFHIQARENTAQRGETVMCFTLSTGPVKRGGGDRGKARSGRGGETNGPGKTKPPESCPPDKTAQNGMDRNIRGNLECLRGQRSALFKMKMDSTRQDLKLSYDSG